MNKKIKEIPKYLDFSDKNIKRFLHYDLSTEEINKSIKKIRDMVKSNTAIDKIIDDSNLFFVQKDTFLLAFITDEVKSLIYDFKEKNSYIKKYNALAGFSILVRYYNYQGKKDNDSIKRWFNNLPKYLRKELLSLFKVKICEFTEDELIKFSKDNDIPKELVRMFISNITLRTQANAVKDKNGNWDKKIYYSNSPYLFDPFHK